MAEIDYIDYMPHAACTCRKPIYSREINHWISKGYTIQQVMDYLGYTKICCRTTIMTPGQIPASARNPTEEEMEAILDRTGKKNDAPAVGILRNIHNPSNPKKPPTQTIASYPPPGSGVRDQPILLPPPRITRKQQKEKFEPSLVTPEEGRREDPGLFEENETEEGKVIVHKKPNVYYAR